MNSYTSLLLGADFLDDIESTRVAAENRLRTIKELRGLDGAPECARWDEVVKGLKAVERAAEREVQRAMRNHPLGPFVNATLGLGEKRVGRLLAATGSLIWKPAMINRDTGEVLEEARLRRGPGELRAYCGLVPGQRLRKGQKANWNTEAKTRVLLIAKSCEIEMRSPYRPVYEQARAKYKDGVHGEVCPQCGPAGSPAQVGSPLSLGHQRANAHRIVAARILRDLWREERRVHGL